MKRPARFPVLCAAVLALAPQALVPHALPAQQPGGHGPAAASLHAHGAAVAVALRIAAGSRQDGDGLEGTAWLLARILEEQVARALDTVPAVFTATVERSTTVFTLVADPAAWQSAWAVADSVVFRSALDPASVERQRSALVESLTFESGSPYQEFEAVLAARLCEPGSPWARPPRGTPASVAAAGPAELERYRNDHFRRDTGAWALVGPASSDLAPPAQTAAPLPPSAPAPVLPPWAAQDRLELDRDVTSTWIAVAYPAPATLPRTHLELLAHLLREELDPVPPTPDRYGVDVRVEETPRGPVLVVEASVVPEAAASWESRILGVVEGLRAEAPADDFFRWRRRRFRAERLLAESAPEVEARRITADLLREGHARDLNVEIWELDAQALLQAARSLGPARILVLGPDLGQNGSRTPQH